MGPACGEKKKKEKGKIVQILDPAYRSRCCQEYHNPVKKVIYNKRKKQRQKDRRFGTLDSARWAFNDTAPYRSWKRPRLGPDLIILTRASASRFMDSCQGPHGADASKAAYILVWLDNDVPKDIIQIQTLEGMNPTADTYLKPIRNKKVSSMTAGEGRRTPSGLLGRTTG